MIESPLLREIEARGRMQARVDDIMDLLNARFGRVPTEIRTRLSQIQDEPTLRTLVLSASGCPDLAAFRSHLPD